MKYMGQWTLRPALLPMRQTPETKKALERDQYLCQWCLRKDKIAREVFQYVKGYPGMGGGHHIFGRARVDVAEATIGLCGEHHWKVENATISMKEYVELQESIPHVDLNQT